MTNIEIANALKCNIFGRRRTLEEAFKDANEILSNMDRIQDELAGRYAIMVICNTIAELIKANEVLEKVNKEN